MWSTKQKVRFALFAPQTHGHTFSHISLYTTDRTTIVQLFKTGGLFEVCLKVCGNLIYMGFQLVIILYGKTSYIKHIPGGLRVLQRARAAPPQPMGTVWYPSWRCTWDICRSVGAYPLGSRRGPATGRPGRIMRRDRRLHVWRDIPLELSSM